MDQKEYLKKYLSSSDGKKKKKKKVVKISSEKLPRSKIIDDDFDLNRIQPIDDADIDILEVNEDAPQIVGYVDDRPDDIRLMTEIRETNKWRIIATDYDDVQIHEKISNGPKINIQFKPKIKEEKLSPDRESSIGKRKNYSDTSPPRKQINSIKKEKSDSDASPPRRNRKNSDSDVSPPRKQRKNSDSDISPPRRQRKNSDSDISPPRRQKKNLDTDVSPPRRSRRNSDSDISPPRRHRKKDYASSSRNRRDYSPSRRVRKGETVSRWKKKDLDDSPPKKKIDSSKRDRSDSDVSPNRKTRTRRTSPSPPRRHKNHSSPSRRHRRHSPERHRRIGDSSKQRKESSPSKKSDSSQIKPARDQPKTLEGKKAGLSQAQELRKELDELRKNQESNLAKLSDEVSGRGAVTIVRDKKTGQIRNLKEESRKKREEEEKKAEIISQYAVWGKGQKQVDDRAKQRQDEEYEMSKPMARYADDKDLEEMLKREERDGDPMLEYIRAKRAKKEGKKGKTLMKKEYQGSYPPNRYNIKPGYRWDGVDRSNGFENKWIIEQNDRIAREEEAAKYINYDL